MTRFPFDCDKLSSAMGVKYGLDIIKLLDQTIVRRAFTQLEGISDLASDRACSLTSEYSSSVSCNSLYKTLWTPLQDGSNMKPFTLGRRK